MGVSARYPVYDFLDVGLSAHNILDRRTQFPYGPPPQEAQLRRSRTLRLWIQARL